MRRRTILRIAGALALAGIALLVFRLVTRPERRQLNVNGFPQVRIGMTQAEVEKLLGGPPGNYGRYARGTGFMTMEGIVVPSGLTEKNWCDDGHRFEIWFDQEGRVAAFHKRAGYSQGQGEGPFDRFWSRLGL